MPKTQPSKGVRVSDVDCQFDKSSVVPDTHDGELSGRDYVMASAQAVYSSVEFQQLLQGTEVCFCKYLVFIVVIKTEHLIIKLCGKSHKTHTEKSKCCIMFLF